jgi:hypothetical protein
MKMPGNVLLSHLCLGAPRCWCSGTWLVVCLVESICICIFCVLIAFFVVSIFHFAHCNYFWHKYNFYLLYNLIIRLVVLLLHLFYYILSVLCVLLSFTLSLCNFPQISWFVMCVSFISFSFNIVSNYLQPCLMRNSFQRHMIMMGTNCWCLVALGNWFHLHQRKECCNGGMRCAWRRRVLRLKCFVG